MITSLHALPLSRSSQEWLFLCFAAAFLVKMPLARFHGWLADAYKSMPIPAVAVFSGILSKVAAYGFLRIVLPLFPQATVHYQMLMLVIALVSILWASAVAFTTNDARLVIAYSSIAQMAFITLGIFSLRAQGGQGALLQMLNHGIVTAAAFFVVAAVAARCGGSEDLREMGGVAFRAPVLATMFLIIALRDPGDARLIQLHRRVHDPARDLQLEDRDRRDRIHRRRRRGRLRAAPVHHRDAQPRRPTAFTHARCAWRRGDRDRAAGDRRSGARAVPAVRAQALPAVAERRGCAGIADRPEAR